MKVSRTVDSRTVPAGSAGQDAGGPGDEEPLGEAKGFDFSVLADRRPELKEDLRAFKDQLLAMDDGTSVFYCYHLHLYDFNAFACGSRALQTP